MSQRCDIIDSEMSGGARSDSAEILKIIAKKRPNDDDKPTAYLARQGFSYDLIKSSIAEYHD